MSDEGYLANRTRVRLDLLIVTVLIVVLTAIHYTHYQYDVNFHIILQFGYYVPVIYAAMRFGLAGGIWSGLVITILFIPHLSHFRSVDPASWYTQCVEVFLINVIGWVTGFLIGQERRATGKYRQALLIQENLVQELTEEGKRRLSLEAEIRQTERLAALGRLSAGLAHEIRNPLGIIQATAQLLAQEKPGDEVVGEYCRVLQEESGRLNRMVNEFLSFARPKNPERQRIALGLLLEEGANLAQSLLRRKGIHLEQNVEPVASELVEADMDQMKQVLLNIFLNAVEAQEEGGTILLEGILSEKFVGLAVSDEGPGVPEDALPYIYDPFFTTKDKGTGLGLSVVHRILDQHGGKISVKNLPGRGARVEILLPRLDLPKS